MDKKNVILLTLDTLRKDVLGCYGSDAGLTPFIDSLCEKSIRFTRCQAIAPYTQASFPGLLTSSYYLDQDDHGKGKTLSPARVMISESLSKNGIVTAAFHSNPYLCDLFGWNRGWRMFYDSMEAEVSDEVPYIKGGEINKKVDAWLGSHAGSGDYERFFLWAHYMDIHEPYVPSKEHVDKVDSSINLSPQEMFALFKDVILPRDASNPETVALLRKLYMAHTIEVDEYTKEFFSILESRGVLKDSVVIVTADHGDEFGEHGGLSHDGKMFSELIDVPLLVYAEGTTAQNCDALVSGVDIPPTIAQLFGLKPAQAFQGTPLLPLADYPQKGCFGEAMGKKGRQKETDRPVYYYRENDLKIIYEEEPDTWHLYDLAEDPAEKKNIIDSAPAAGEMKEKLKPRIERSR